MVKIERTPTAPPSLAIEAQKAHGDYAKPDVVEQLCIDFHKKCYLCELDHLTDAQIEHLRPHQDRAIPERVFDWNNLFLSCPHCNSMKNKREYDDKILDCCQVDPEMVLDHLYLDDHVEVYPHDRDSGEETILQTAKLLQSCFENRSTGIRVMQCQERFKRLAEAMNALYVTLDRYKKNKTSVKYIRALQGMLSREYKFAAYVRYYVRSHLEDYPELSEYVAL